MSSKIKTLEEITEICARLRAEGKIIVTINGSFDMTHPGHGLHLRKAKEQGDILVVGMNSDSSIKLYKSEHRPVYKQEWRAQMLAYFESVDYVVIYNETTPHRFIRAVRPHIHANDSRYGENCVEADAIKECGAKLYMITEHVEGVSTTNIIKYIQNMPKED